MQFVGQIGDDAGDVTVKIFVEHLNIAAGHEAATGAPDHHGTHAGVAFRAKGGVA